MVVDPTAGRWALRAGHARPLQDVVERASGAGTVLRNL